jgi:ferric-dicitrate binding protein FerR (iron transport regulator)
MSKTTDDKKLNFVLRHYRKGSFNPDEAIKKVAKPARRIPLRHWVAMAASLLCLVVFATVLTWHAVMSSPSATPQSAPTQTAIQTTHEFHFNDAPLPQVLKELEQYYGIRLEANDTTKHLTGSFTADNLELTLRMIEEVLDVEISTRQ